MRSVASASGPPSFGLAIVYAAWLLLMLDPHRYLAVIGPTVINRSLTLTYLILLLLLALRAGDLISSMKSWMLGLPMLAFALSAFAAAPGAIHVGFARGIAEGLFLYWVLIVATVLFVRRPRDAQFILYLFPLQFLWYAYHAKTSALVRWHPYLSNYDGYGAFMVLGIAICFYFALATDHKWLKRLCFALAGYCVLGVVTSFARGAFLAAVLIGAILWLRSPRKLPAALASVGGLVIVLVVSSIAYPDGAYWDRIMSSFEQGTHSGTGGHRWALWEVAWNVFLENPILGVGGYNFGLYAVQNYGYENVYLYTSAAGLWDRNLHNIFVQILCEFGLLGSLALIWLTVDFWKRNRALRTARFMEAWRVSTGGRLDLRYVSYALELAMIGYLATGLVYAQIEHHWHYTLIGANLMLYASVRRTLESSRPRRRRRQGPAPASSAAAPPIGPPVWTP